jgi:hypothetical protein
VLVVCWAFAGCRTSQKFAQQTNVQERIESETSISEQTEQHADFNAVTTVFESSENNINFNGTLWSAPDSLGNQYPKVTFNGTKVGNSKKSTQQKQQQINSEKTITDTKSAVQSESVAEQTTHLETTRWTLSDIIHLAFAAVALVIAVVIYFKFIKK